MVKKLKRIINKIKAKLKNFKHRKDELYKRKILLISEKVFDYYLTDYDEETAKIKTDAIMLEAINQDKIDMLYTRHIRNKQRL